MSHVPGRGTQPLVPSVNVGDHVGAGVAGADDGGFVSPALVGVGVGDAVGAEHSSFDADCPAPVVARLKKTPELPPCTVVE
jgi:hypothetical protein